jgi:hypothetical protein
MNDGFVTIEATDLETAIGGLAGARSPGVTSNGAYSPPLTKAGKIDWPHVNWNKMLTGPFFEK